MTEPDPRAPEVLAILSRECGLPVEQLRPEATVESLGIASIDLVQAIFAVESRWNVEVPVAAEREGAEFATVGDLLRQVLRTLDEAGIPPEAGAPPARQA